MKVEEIAEAIAKLPPDQLARFRRWFTAFETGRTDHAKELDSTATKLGRLAGRAFAELKKRAKEPCATPAPAKPQPSSSSPPRPLRLNLPSARYCATATIRIVSPCGAFLPQFLPLSPGGVLAGVFFRPVGRPRNSHNTQWRSHRILPALDLAVTFGWQGLPLVRDSGILKSVPDEPHRP